VSWLKLSDTYHRELARLGLSDAAFRTHTEALNGVMDMESGGLLDVFDLPAYCHSRDRDRAVQELLDHGLWVRESDTVYRIVHHMEWQVEPEVLEARRAADAARQARARAKKAGLPPPQSRRDVTRDVTRDDPRDHWSGRDGSGLAGEPQDQPSPEDEEECPTCRWPLGACPCAA
jgi:hypothetical protein